MDSRTTWYLEGSGTSERVKYEAIKSIGINSSGGIIHILNLNNWKWIAYILTYTHLFVSTEPDKHELGPIT